MSWFLFFFFNLAKGKDVNCLDICCEKDKKQWI